MIINNKFIDFNTTTDVPILNRRLNQLFYRYNAYHCYIFENIIIHIGKNTIIFNNTLIMVCYDYKTINNNDYFFKKGFKIIRINKILLNNYPKQFSILKRYILKPFLEEGGLLEVVEPVNMSEGITDDLKIPVFKTLYDSKIFAEQFIKDDKI